MNDAPIQRELTIAAPPETVFALLTDPERICTWMGRRVSSDPTQGGTIRIDYNGFDIMRGTFVEVVPFTRVVYSWGWESLDADAVKPGGSTVEFTLTPEAGGTKLRLVHSGLEAMAAASHAQGWDLFLGRLGEAASGRAPSPAAALSEAEELASRLNSLLVRAIDAIDACPGDRWQALIASEGRTAAAVAHHLVQHLQLVDFGRAIVSGALAPQSEFSRADLDAFNAAQGRESATVAKSVVVAEARQAGPGAVAAVKALETADLDRSRPMKLLDGAPLSVRALLQGPLLGDMEAHLAALTRA